MGSNFIIQNNCTSAIEAAASNIPVITYALEPENLTCLSDGKENVPNNISINIFGKEKLVEAMKDIKSIWNRDENKKQREKILKRKLKEYGTIKSAENIAQEIINYVGSPNPQGNRNLGMDSIFYDVYELYNQLKYKLNDNRTVVDMNKKDNSLPRIRKILQFYWSYEY